MVLMRISSEAALYQGPNPLKGALNPLEDPEVIETAIWAPGARGHRHGLSAVAVPAGKSLGGKGLADFQITWRFPKRACR